MAAFLGVQYKGILGSGFALGQKGIRMPSGGALLLDQYSGAAAAYSVRKLSSSYSGSALRVRRSSDNAEQDIGFSGNDLDTSALTTFVGANDGFVTTWYDQSGNGIDFTQSSASNQPQIVSSGSVITDGGLAAVSFDGIDDNMTSLLNFNGTALTQIMVNNYDYTANTSTFPHLWSGPGYENRVFAISKTGLSYYTSGSGLSSSGVITNYTTNGYNGVKTILSFTIENSGGGYDLNANLNNDTVINKTNSSVPLNSITSQILGAMPASGGNTKMLVSEFIQYPSNQYTNIVDINNLINAYYNIYWDGSQTGLLDDYPSASAAYSVRALNSAYTDPILRVRRSSDNAEQDIKALYDGNLDEDSLLSFVGAGDGFVTTWYDQSGNGNDATQATAANQPQIVSSGTIEKIGLKPVLKAVSGNTLLSTSLSGSTDTWSFSVNQFSSIASGGNVLVLSSGVGSYLISSNGSSSSSIVGATYKSVRDNTVELLTTTRDDIYDAIVTRSLLTTNVNDSSFTNKQFGHPSTTAFSMPDLQEYIEYHTDQSANRADIESNINTYYDFYWDGTVSDPDAQAYLDEVVAQGGSLTNKVANEYNDFVLREKANSRYSKLLRLYPFLGGVIDSARIDAITLAQATNNNFVDADVDSLIGIQGDGSTKYMYDSPINTIYSSPYDIQQGDYNIVKRSSASDIYYGVRDLSPASIEHRIGANFFQTWNPSTSFATTKYSPILDNQWLSFARYNDSLSTVYIDDASGSLTTTVSYSLSSLNQMVYGRNANGTYSGGSLDNKLGCRFMAQGMDETDLLAFQTSYKTFVNNITA